MYRIGFEKEKKVWFTKISSIIQESPVILFMPGTPQTPNQCGNSSVLLDILKKHGVEYTYYNVFDDNKIPQWVRFYSGHQTYPQLFVEGKFLGDVTICLSLEKKGEFISKIPKSSLPIKNE